MSRRFPTALLLVVGLLLALTAAPAAAWPWDDEPDNGSDPARPTTWGRTSAADQRLAPGCHRYRYRYLVTPPSDEWSAEIFLENPRGRGVASAYYVTPEDADHGAATWKLCTTSTGPGRYTIRMRVTWVDGRENRSGWVSPSTFRMTRR